MTAGLRQIVYTSRAVSSCDDDEVREIGEVARVRNMQYDVTGLLLFDGKRFIQAIEGPQDAVQATMDRIRCDRRHIYVSIASDRPVDRRQFGSWSMETKRTPRGGCCVSFLRTVKRQMTTVDDVELQALFIGFSVMGMTARN